MPTAGWLLEGAVERFWEGQHAHSGPVDLPVYLCERCGAKLASPEELSHHISLQHPLELPTLYVKGEPLLRESAIRAKIQESHVDLLQCTRCEVQMDGGPWQTLTVHDFRHQFTTQVNAIWNVRLVNERAIDETRTKGEYQLRFRVPGSVALDAVDEHFLQTLVLEDIQHSNLDRFEAGLPEDTATREYGCALGDYALGIILKERTVPPHAPVGFDEFTVKMRSSLEILRLFYRPVALAVVDSIRFSLNDFWDHGAVAASELEPGLRFFRSLTNPLPSGTPTAQFRELPFGSTTVPICPVDKVSHRLLSACTRFAKEGKLSLMELESLRQLTRGANPVSEQDLTKAHAICAVGYLRLARNADAIPHLRAIQFDPSFRGWAQTQLNTASPNET